MNRCADDPISLSFLLGHGIILARYQNEDASERRFLDLNQDSGDTATLLTASQPPIAPLGDRATRVTLGLILAAVFLSYSDTLWFQFVLDDRVQIGDNTWLRSWRYLPRYFTGDVWSFMHPGFPGNYYRPVFLLWLRLQYIVFGLNPWGWHFCTILAHVGVTLLVYYLSVRLVKDRRAALFAALIFGLHPVHAEAVAWISGVTEPMLAIFLIASFLCYLHRKTEHTHDRAWLSASLALYVLAMLAKETALVLPLIILASEVIGSEPGGTSRWHAGLHRVGGALAVIAPYMVLSAAYLGLRVTALRGFQNPRESRPIFNMVLTWPSVLWFYVRHLFWPVGLGPVYDLDFVTRLDVRNVLLPALVVALIATGLAVWAARSAKAARATLWLVLPILPVLYLRVFTSGQFVHDRYLYLPSIGFAMLAGVGLSRVRIGSARLLGQPAILVVLALVLTLWLATSINEETAYFANPNTYFTRANSMPANSATAKLNLAGMLGEQGHLDEAIKIYQQVWPTRPDDWDVNYNLGYAYYLTGRLPEADRFLSRAVELEANHPDALFYLGLTKLKKGDINSAAADVQRAIAIRPDAVHYHFAMGVILKLQGNLPGALSEFHQEMDLDPDDASAREQAREIEAGQSAAPQGIPLEPAPGSSAVR
jgi:tetratricopeptide (TPR) repeat protein